MALLEKKIRSHMFSYLETSSYKKAHYLLSIKYISSQDRITLLKNIPTFVQGQREEEMPKDSVS